MNDSQLLRYSRHILLDDIGIEGQEKLLASHVLIVGAGGLGSPVALYLGSAGVGRLTIIDDDRVDATNLQRQIAHKLSGIGGYKADSICQAVADINPDVHVTAVTRRANQDLLNEWVARADVVVDCTDNFQTRHAINRAAVRHARPLVSGAAIRFDGQVSVYDRRNEVSPCYACLFPPSVDFAEALCATMGVFAPLVGIIGSIQAAEVIKLLCGVGEPLSGRLLMLDGRAMEWTQIQLHKNATCEVCNGSQQEVFAGDATHSR
ncbi:MAG: [sulfur carrier protein ThiS] adenylyltransferase [Polaromonas sp.]|jgi:molybdopterin/thiamine biosynthesis adenylyltransferase|nr:[sulfur carrier protein ThiS] adenylyltransferase [Polaromonas sp.]